MPGRASGVDRSDEITKSLPSTTHEAGVKPFIESPGKSADLLHFLLAGS